MGNIIRIEDNTPFLVPEVAEKLAEFEKKAKEIKAKQDEIKKAILEEMEQYNILKIDTESLSITYVAPTTRETFNSKKFAEDNPELYDEYVSISPVKASIRMKIK